MEYIKILLGMMFSYGTIIAFIATLDPILKSMHYDDPNQMTAVTILFAMLIGIVATPVFSNIIKRTKKYKLVTSLSRFLFLYRHHWLLCFPGSHDLHLYTKN